MAYESARSAHRDPRGGGTRRGDSGGAFEPLGSGGQPSRKRWRSSREPETEPEPETPEPERRAGHARDDRAGARACTGARRRSRSPIRRWPLPLPRLALVPALPVENRRDHRPRAARPPPPAARRRLRADRREPCRPSRRPARLDLGAHRNPADPGRLHRLQRGAAVHHLAGEGLTIASVAGDPLFGGYSLLVTLYVLARFSLAPFYRPTPDTGLRPSCSIVIPAFNEEGCIEATVDACFSADYPRDLIEVVVVDDGSSDRTWERMLAARERYPSLLCVQFSQNRGKRAAMAEGIRRSSGEICVFIDSDSVIEPDGLAHIMADFRDERVGASVGTADVMNKAQNLMTKMQQVRYFVAFRVVKGSESVFGAVTCASGCFSAYRRSALLEMLQAGRTSGSWAGPPPMATIARSRTTSCATTGSPTSPWHSSHTLAPDTLKAFLMQQMRWRKSWVRESLHVVRFIWRKHPVGVFAHLPRHGVPVGGPGGRIPVALLAQPHDRRPLVLPHGRLRHGVALLALLRRLAEEPALASRHHVHRDLHGVPGVDHLLRGAHPPGHQLGHPRVHAHGRRGGGHGRRPRLSPRRSSRPPDAPAQEACLRAPPMAAPEHRRPRHAAAVGAPDLVLRDPHPRRRAPVDAGAVRVLPAVDPDAQHIQ